MHKNYLGSKKNMGLLEKFLVSKMVGFKIGISKNGRSPKMVEVGKWNMSENGISPKMECQKMEEVRK